MSQILQQPVETFIFYILFVFKGKSFMNVLHESTYNSMFQAIPKGQEAAFYFPYVDKFSKKVAFLSKKVDDG